MYVPRPQRALAGGASVALALGLVALFVLSLNVRPLVQRSISLISLDLSQPPPQPRPTERPAPKPRARKPAPKHEASPENTRNKATEVVVPPVRPIVPPPPVVTTPKAGPGAAANNGAANRPGPGQGAGGIGNGLGGGGLGGDGHGDGDGDSVEGPRRISGSLHYSDLPDGVLAPGEEATVAVIDTIEADGHVSHCKVERSSGYPVLDRLACRLNVERYRYRPARDEDGRPVWSREGHTETWTARER
jgi:protein TonB